MLCQRQPLNHLCQFTPIKFVAPTRLNEGKKSEGREVNL